MAICNTTKKNNKQKKVNDKIIIYKKTVSDKLTVILSVVQFDNIYKIMIL